MEEWKPRSVGVIGLGYVGLPLAVGFAQAGLTIHGVEQNTDKVTRVNAGDSYIDDVAPARLQAVVASGALTASTEFSALKDCDAVVVCVPTPLTVNRLPTSRTSKASRALSCRVSTKENWSCSRVRPIPGRRMRSCCPSWRAAVSRREWTSTLLSLLNGWTPGTLTTTR